MYCPRSSSTCWFAKAPGTATCPRLSSTDWSAKARAPKFLSADVTRGFFLTGDVPKASALDVSKVLRPLLVRQGSEEQRRVQGPPAPAGLPRLLGSVVCPRLSSTSWSAKARRISDVSKASLGSWRVPRLCQGSVILHVWSSLSPLGLSLISRPPCACGNMFKVSLHLQLCPRLFCTLQ